MNLCIIQARSTSTRLPGKVVMNLKGKSLIQRVYNQSLWPAVIAFPEGDEIVKRHCIEHDLMYFEGDEHDVLKRYYECAVLNKATRIMRLTADCPVIPIDVIITCASIRGDIVSNVMQPRRTIDGWDCEVFSFDVLKWVHEHATEKSDREHVTPYLYRNIDKCAEELKCSVVRVDPPLDMSWFKCSIDTQEDFDRVERLIAE